jgi:hypothetical protein
MEMKPWQVSRSLELSREPTLDVHLVKHLFIYHGDVVEG